MSALRAIPAAVLSSLSAALSGAAKLAELGARQLSPPPASSRESVFVDTTPSPLATVQAAKTPGEILDVTADEVLDDLGTAGDAVDQTVDAASQRVGDVVEVTGDRVEDAAVTVEEAISAAQDEVEAGAAETGVTADLPPADDDGRQRTYESHIAALAEHPVARVVKEIQDLSTEELGQLFEYESAHRKRKTVLQAIERASAPE